MTKDVISKLSKEESDNFLLQTVCMRVTNEIITFNPLLFDVMPIVKGNYKLQELLKSVEIF